MVSSVRPSSLEQREGGEQRAAPGSASSHLPSAPKCQSGYDDAPVFPVFPVFLFSLDVQGRSYYIK